MLNNDKKLSLSAIKKIDEAREKVGKIVCLKGRSTPIQGVVRDCDISIDYTNHKKRDPTIEIKYLIQWDGSSVPMWCLNGSIK